MSEKGKLVLPLIIGMSKKPKAQEIGILLYQKIIEDYCNTVLTPKVERVLAYAFFSAVFLRNLQSVLLQGTYLVHFTLKSLESVETSLVIDTFLGILLF